MFKIRKSSERGLADHGWLKSHHTFSFADYYDPRHMGFHSLRVINEDRIHGGTGFGTHPHRDMEIISYVVKGGLIHQDSMGNKAMILPGEVQRMSAGTGIRHSEYNSDSNEVTHFLQIWIIPKTTGGSPSYGQKSFEQDLNSKPLVLVISQNGRDGSIDIKQDADVYISRSPRNTHFEFNLRAGRGAWVQVIKGTISIDAHLLEPGDAIAISEEHTFEVKSLEDSEFLLFDLA